MRSSLSTVGAMRRRPLQGLPTTRHDYHHHRYAQLRCCCAHLGVGVGVAAAAVDAQRSISTDMYKPAPPGMPSYSSEGSAIGSGGMKFTPAGITALSALEDADSPIYSARNVAAPGFGQAPTVIDSAAPPLLMRRPEDSAERARRLRHYRPVTLAVRERIVNDSDAKVYHRVTPEAGFGERVDEFLKRQHPDFSHDTFRRLVEAGHVYRYRDGNKIYCKLTDRLHNGEFLVVPTQRLFAQLAPPRGDVYESLRTGSGEQAREFRDDEERRKTVHLSYKTKEAALDWVLFKNEYVIVINKPSGVPITKTADGSLNVSDMLPAWKFTLTHRPVICNYLDRDTSGIVVLARTHDTHRMLGRTFQKRNVPNSSYWGFCVGTPKVITGRVKMHLEEPTRGMVVARTTPTAESKVAIAEYVVNANAAEYASFISFYPLTSRTHQLRIMAAHALRCPVVGDAKFGGDNAFPESLDALLGRSSDDEAGRKSTKLHLHFRKIQLPYKKRNGEFECISAPIPEHMASTFRKLGWATNLDDPLIPG